jgi:hypothetical protein
MVPTRLLVHGLFILECVALAPQARAEEPATYADRADDPIADADRTVAFLLNPLATAVGVFGGEADFVLGRLAAIAVEGDLYRRGDVTGLAVGAGLPVFPMGRVLHGLYLEPRITYARPIGESIPAFDWETDVIGLGGTAGWQWTWDYGFSVRIGGGAMYFVGGPRHGPFESRLALGPQLVLDGSVGWAF